MERNNLNKHPKIIIIGAGLTGLTIAYLLQKRNISVQILEANAVLGGRIETVIGENGTTIELGATWFSRVHTCLVSLLNELDLDYFEQDTKGVSLFEKTATEPPQKFTFPNSEEPSFRIIGGTSKLISALTNSIPKGTVFLNTKVDAIKEIDNTLEIHCSNKKVFTPDIVISTIPPNLLVNSVSFFPELPIELLTICKKTHTWMGESIKFGVEYMSPFWKEKNFSGCVFSQKNIIQEQYDHSSFNNKSFALKGFLHGECIKMTKEEREKIVIDKLTNFFGEEATSYLAYYEKVWSDDSLVFFPYDEIVFPHQNNGDSIYVNTYFNGKLFISGTETSTKFGGYMEGAIHAAKSVVDRINVF